MSATHVAHVDEIVNQLFHHTWLGCAGHQGRFERLEKCLVDFVVQSWFSCEHGFHPFGGFGPVGIRFRQFIPGVCPRQISYSRPVGQVRRLVKRSETMSAVLFDTQCP
jgi:hypothetical protein